YLEFGGKGTFVGKLTEFAGWLKPRQRPQSRVGVPPPATDPTGQPRSKVAMCGEFLKLRPGSSRSVDPVLLQWLSVAFICTELLVFGNEKRIQRIIIPIHLSRAASVESQIKSVLIQLYARRGDAVLDLACGKGGDLIKWDKAKIGYYVGIDIAEGSVRLDKVLAEDAPFDICSCQKFKSSNPFGIQYKFHLEDAVDCPEWIVPFHVFKSLAEEYDLEVVFVKNSHEFVHEYMKKPEYVELMRRLGALGDGNQDQSTLSPDEWEVAYLYLAFVLKKVRHFSSIIVWTILHFHAREG
ncbi:hypothetical protein CRG98_045872, partial [Punica granatum]